MNLVNEMHADCQIWPNSMLFVSSGTIFWDPIRNSIPYPYIESSELLFILGIKNANYWFMIKFQFMSILQQGAEFQAY